MHLVNVLSFGSKNFNTSLEELKAHLDFKLILIDKLKEEELKDYDILILHQDCLKIESVKKILQESQQIKILVSNNTVKQKDYFSDIIPLPLKLSELNRIIENLVAKKNFNKNSSILLKEYRLNKNEKKLVKDKNYISLTEKEIQLLELLLINKRPISKNKILEEVWKYSTSADTHTVETHIYRLRKKIKSKFKDENFILNNKSGYLL
jgi:DNA-binding response OmpR family regulator